MPTKTVLAALLLLATTISRAQDTLQKKSRSSDTLAHLEKFIIMSEYPGGDSAWKKYVNHTLHYPDDAVNNMIQGDVVVKFKIDEEGNTSDFQVVSGPKKGGLREEAIRVIRESGKWIPEVMNGKNVASFRSEKLSWKISN